MDHSSLNVVSSVLCTCHLGLRSISGETRKRRILFVWWSLMQPQKQIYTLMPTCTAYSSSGHMQLPCDIHVTYISIVCIMFGVELESHG